MIVLSGDSDGHGVSEVIVRGDNSVSGGNGVSQWWQWVLWYMV